MFPQSFLDRNNGICFSRKLFGRHEHLDHDNHYPLLWNDMWVLIIYLKCYTPILD